MPFLKQVLPADERGKVLGISGVSGDGCIVMTGPDNNFHGALDITGPNAAARENQHNLLFNELDWLLNSTEYN